MDIWTIVIAILGGFVAGVINILAGNGSAITLPILMELLGLPANVANGTNRIGIFVQGIIGSTTFYKHGKLPIRSSMIFVIPAFFGAMIGVYWATIVTPEQFRMIFGYVLILMVIIIFLNPKRWLQPKGIVKNPIILGILSFFLGIYGGFIQMGMGVFVLAVLVLLAGKNIIVSNAIKIFIVVSYTGVVLLIFAYKGLVHWEYGLLIAIGQGFGGWVSARWASKYPGADVWAFRLLILTMIWAIWRIFV